MPRKTRKEKILADIHRQKQPKHFKIHLTTESNHILPAATIPSPDSEKLVKDFYVKQNTPLLISDYKYVKKDLLRITIFTMLALAINGMLYFIMNRGFS